MNVGTFGILVLCLGKHDTTEIPDCFPEIGFLPMRERRVELDTSGPFVTPIYFQPCYATDGPVIELLGCNATIYASNGDPSDSESLDPLYLEAFSLAPNVPSKLKLSNRLLRDGALYVWIESQGRVSAVRKIDMCRRAVLAIPSVGFPTEKKWLTSIVNMSMLGKKSRLLAAGIVSSAQTRLLYRPAPLLVSLSADVQLSNFVNIRVMYTIVEGDNPNIYDVCEIPSSVIDVPCNGIQVMQVSRFMCSQLRSGIWRIYNSSNVPSVLPPATLYMASVERGKLLPSLVTYVTYPINRTLERLVEKTLSETSIELRTPDIIVFLLEISGLGLFGLIILGMLGRMFISHDRIRPGKMYTFNSKESWLLMDLNKKRNIWLLRYNSRLDLTPLTNMPNWKPYVRISTKIVVDPKKQFAQLMKTIAVPHNVCLHRRRLILEYLVRESEVCTSKVFYRNSNFSAGSIPEAMLQGKNIMHVIVPKCVEEVEGCSQKVCWFLADSVDSKCFCAKHVPKSESAQLILIARRPEERCMFCLLMRGTHTCLQCAGGSLFCRICEELLHSNCKIKHRVITFETD